MRHTVRHTRYLLVLGEPKAGACPLRVRGAGELPSATKDTPSTSHESTHAKLCKGMSNKECKKDAISIVAV